MKLFALSFAVIFFLNLTLAIARDFRVAQIPNGNTFQCLTCHTTPGGPRNNFGKDISKSFLNMSGNVIWGQELAKLNSDGDGFTNGQELGDPDGTWKAGEPDPVVMGGVFNPGDANSKPPIGFVVNSDEIPANSDVSIFEINPSPINDFAEVRIDIRKDNYFKIEIFDLSGKKVTAILDEYKTTGEYRLLFDISDLANESIKSGTYIFKLSFDSNAIIRKVIIKH